MKKLPIHIKAINPGYTVDKKSNVGEFIELARDNDADSDAPILLTGLILGYTNSSGNSVHLYEFPENSWLIGESILLRLSSSPGGELAHITYSKTLAMKAGPLDLIYDDEIIDSLCWTGEDGCYRGFNSKNFESLVYNEEEKFYSFEKNYSPVFDELSYEIKNLVPVEEQIQNEPEKIIVEQNEILLPKCQGLLFSELFSYYENESSEQFIELINQTNSTIDLAGCKLEYKNKTYPLDGFVPPWNYFVYHPTDFSLTKNPTSENMLKIIDVDGSIVSELKYSSQKKGMSLAKIGNEWLGTYTRTPGAENILAEHKPCEEGYVINPETGYCKKQKINTGAEYGIVEEEFVEQKSFTALYSVIVIVVLAICYIVFQFRKELKKFFCKVYRRFRHKLHHEGHHHSH